jgi:molecular chaperone GrpE
MTDDATPVTDDAMDEAVDPDPVVLAAQLEAATEEIVALKDQALRAQAEVENIRRRAGRDVENAHKYALERFTAELLTVVDTLEKAVANTPAKSDSAGGIVEGVDLSLKLFLDVLGKAGVVQLDPLGEPFDPEQHEAMTVLENADTEPNSVLEVMQKGYVLNGRLLRAAMVVVSKEPAATGPVPDAADLEDGAGESEG